MRTSDLQRDDFLVLDSVNLQYLQKIGSRRDEHDDENRVSFLSLYTLSRSSSLSKEPCLLKQHNLNDLGRELGLSTSKAQLLGLRLKQIHLLDKNTKVSYFRTRQGYVRNIF